MSHVELGSLERPRRRPRWARALFGLAAALALLVFLEGLASSWLFLADARREFEPVLRERLHTDYDPELGWVNRPSVSDADLYGPGRGFTSNARGFRNREEIEVAAPSGRARVVCVGDSFTLGYGVGDGDSWPARLEAEHPALQAVNMGQGGYGIDQAWLWYRRDAAALEHRAVVFAFIGDDFDRARSPLFWGYGKPLLRADEGGLRTTNVPVPRSAFRFPLLSQNLRLLGNSRLVELLSRALGRDPTSGARRRAEVGEDEARRVAVEVFRALDARARERGARALLVLLPCLQARNPDHLRPVPEYALRACREAEALGIPFLDLTGDFAAVDAASRRALFIAPGELKLPGAAGHYSAAGNAFVARRVLDWLVGQNLLEPALR